MPTNGDAQRKIRFDGTINLGHILTFVGVLCAGFAAWATMDKRVVVLEEARLVQTQIDRRQDEDRADIRRLMREDIKDLSNKVDRLLDRGGPPGSYKTPQH